MKAFYTHYKSEILTCLGVLLPLLLAGAGRYLPSNVVSQHFITNWPYYVVATLIVYVSYLHFGQRKKPLVKYAAGGNPDFLRTVNLGHSLYWYMGMGAEELLRDVNIEEYFVERRNGNRPVRSLRFLFLSPHSRFFKERLLEVNPHCDIDAVACAKENYLKTLHSCLATLPPDTVDKCEIRYYDEKPVWLLQFFDTTASSGAAKEPEGVILSMHIPRIHSRFSNQYICRKQLNNQLFDSFLRFFEAVWERSEPATIAGEFPRVSSRNAAITE